MNCLQRFTIEIFINIFSTTLGLRGRHLILVSGNTSKEIHIVDSTISSSNVHCTSMPYKVLIVIDHNKFFHLSAVLATLCCNIFVTLPSL